VSQVVGSGQRSRGKGRHARGGNKVREDSSAAPTCGDKVTNTGGAAMTGR
jgi:hypothetical protein